MLDKPIAQYKEFLKQSEELDKRLQSLLKRIKEYREFLERKSNI